MNVLQTHINAADAAFKTNRDRMQQLVSQLRDRLTVVRQGGGPKYLQRHRDQGKLPVRERIDRLLDPGSPFLELSPLAAWDLYDNEAPGAGLVTGIGRVSGREVLIVANDATVKGAGTIFLAGPPLVKAATGEEVSAEELGGADVHTRISGVADYFADNDEHALALCRTIVSTLNAVKHLPADMIAPEDPRYDPAEIYGIVNADIRKQYDVHEIVARLVDGSRFDEFKERYGATLVTGFARLHGFLVGIIANNGVLFSESALKATHLIELCNLRRMPPILLPNINR